MRTSLLHSAWRALINNSLLCRQHSPVVPVPKATVFAISPRCSVTSRLNRFAKQVVTTVWSCLKQREQAQGFNISWLLTQLKNAGHLPLQTKPCMQIQVQCSQATLQQWHYQIERYRLFVLFAKQLDSNLFQAIVSQEYFSVMPRNFRSKASFP